MSDNLDHAILEETESTISLPLANQVNETGSESKEEDISMIAAQPLEGIEQIEFINENGPHYLEEKEAEDAEEADVPAPTQGGSYKSRKNRKTKIRKYKNTRKHRVAKRKTYRKRNYRKLTKRR